MGEHSDDTDHFNTEEQRENETGATLSFSLTRQNSGVLTMKCQGAEDGGFTYLFSDFIFHLGQLERDQNKKSTTRL